MDCSLSNHQVATLLMPSVMSLGEIQRDEMEKTLANFGVKITREDLDLLMGELDPNGDGKVCSYPTYISKIVLCCVKVGVHV